MKHWVPRTRWRRTVKQTTFRHQGQGEHIGFSPPPSLRRRAEPVFVVTAPFVLSRPYTHRLFKAQTKFQSWIQIRARFVFFFPRVALVTTPATMFSIISRVSSPLKHDVTFSGTTSGGRAVGTRRVGYKKLAKQRRKPARGFANRSLLLCFSSAQKWWVDISNRCMMGNDLKRIWLWSSVGVR